MQITCRHPRGHEVGDDAVDDDACGVALVGPGAPEADAVGVAFVGPGPPEEDAVGVALVGPGPPEADADDDPEVRSATLAMSCNSASAVSEQPVRTEARNFSTRATKAATSDMSAKNMLKRSAVMLLYT